MAGTSNPIKIPDKDCLYIRVHKNIYQKSKPEYVSQSVFKPNGGGISTDWDYKTGNRPHITRNRVVSFSKNPEDYGVAKLSVKEIRNSLTDLKLEMIKENSNYVIVEYHPIEDNDAHTHINLFPSLDKPNRLKYQRELSKIAQLIIKPFEPFVQMP